MVKLVGVCGRFFAGLRRAKERDLSRELHALPNLIGALV